MEILAGLRKRFSGHCCQMSHAKSQVEAMCLDQKCKYFRLLCRTCRVEQHDFHPMISLVNVAEKLQDPEYKLNCLRANSRFNHPKEAELTKLRKQRLNSKFNQIMKEPGQLLERLKTMMLSLQKMKDILIDSFESEKPIKTALEIINSPDSGNKEAQLEQLVDRINLFDEKEWLQDNEAVFEYLGQVQLQISLAFSASKPVYETMHQLGQKVHYWSCFEMHQKTIEEVKEELPHHIEPKQNHHYPSQLHNEGIQMRLSRIARENNWTGITEWVKEGEKLSDLTNLRLISRKIQKIEVSLTEPLVSLSVLELEKNEIHKMENLNYLVSLKTLNLSYNKIKKIENIDALVHLVELYLGHNQIQNVENVRHLQSLETLDLNHNKIVTVGDEIGELRKIKLIDLRQNLIKYSNILDEDFEILLNKLYAQKGVLVQMDQ